MTELTTVATRLSAATSYLDVFGACKGSATDQQGHIKKVYWQLARVVHPDRYSDAQDLAISTEAFQRLRGYRDEAAQAIDDGHYGEVANLATIQTRRGSHVISKLLTSGDIADIFSGMKDGTVPAYYKVARASADNDLLQNEAKALRHLRADGSDAAYHPYIPELIESFGFRDGDTRAVNALTVVDGLQPLSAVRRAYPQGIHPLDMAWMWRRLLVALGYAHRCGVIHGAITPEHVLIHPEQHGLVLIDWCYASIKDDSGAYPPIRAIPSAYRGWYPKEVLDRQAPAPATDIAMAARCMIYLLGGDGTTGKLPDRIPVPFRAFMRSCLAASIRARPDDAWQLMQEFDELLERLGSPYYPRRFRPFSVPTN